MQTINLSIPYQQIQAICQRYHVNRLALFGSVLRSDFSPTSDVDVLVEYEPDARISLFDMVDLQSELEGLLGRRVDLGTPTSLSKYIRNAVLESARVIYERA